MRFMYAACPSALHYCWTLQSPRQTLDRTSPLLLRIGRPHFPPLNGRGRRCCRAAASTVGAALLLTNDTHADARLCLF